MSGIRKSGKIKTLMNLNEQFELGMTYSDISNLSTSQLRRKIFEIKKTHSLPMNSQAKHQLPVKVEEKSPPTPKKKYRKRMSYEGVAM